MAVDAERSLEHPAGSKLAGPRSRRLLSVLRTTRLLGFSSLTRRIIVLNLAGLVALLFGILFLNQFRAGLIDARVQSLLVQGEIIAAAVASSATVETNTIWVDPEKLLDLKAGQSIAPSDEEGSSLEFSINPEQVAPVLRRLVSPTKTRARIYDRDGAMLLDSRFLYSRGDVLRFDLPAPQAETPGVLDRIASAVKGWFSRTDLAPYQELAYGNGRGYPEVAAALNGGAASVVRVNDRGEIIVLVAVPIQRFRAVAGALLLSTQGGDIDSIVQAERVQILRVFMVAAAVMVVLSFLLANTIAGPVRRLAAAAERVRFGTSKRRAQIPDLTNRADEIGHLSGAIRDMTNALYKRIEAIESFAADVAHELKNPLTSLRSAVETLPRAKTEESKTRLMDIIQHDIRRLDRLISDISDASRLDAELQRLEAEPVDVPRLLRTVIGLHNEVRREDGVRVTLDIADVGRKADGFIVLGHDSRFGQIVNNLIDNARSFSPPGGEVRVTCRRARGFVEIVVDDDGPGIRDDAFERIFDRFYTDRPEQGFGQNSGLGLSISKQIVEAYGGEILAQNRAAANGEPGAVAGARFIVRLPAAGGA